MTPSSVSAIKPPPYAEYRAAIIESRIKLVEAAAQSARHREAAE